MSPLSEAALDAILLAFFSAPFISFFTIRPYIHQRDEAEQQRNKIQHRHQIFLDNVNDGIIGINESGKISFINPAATKILGWNKQELLDQEPHNFFHYDSKISTLSK